MIVSARVKSATNPREPFRPANGSLGPFGIYFGWYNVALSLLCIMTTVGATNYSFGLFVKPTAAELGLTRANTNLGLILLHIGTAVAAPIIGNIIYHVPRLALLRTSALLFATGMAGVGLSSSPIAIAAFIVGPIAFGCAGSSVLFGIVLNSGWFTDQRGRALSIMALGTSFGGMFIFPIVAALIASLGWRLALITTGTGVATIVLLASLFMRVEPDPLTAAQLKERASMPESVPLKNGDIVRMRDFWFITLPVSMLLAVDGALLATVTPYILDRGMGLAAAASIMSATTASAIAGKLGIAMIADRSDLRLLLGITALFDVSLCLTLTTDPSYGVILAVSLMTGMAIGGTYPLQAAITAQRFGAASVGRALGIIQPILAVLSMCALYFVGAVHDRTGSYNFAWLTFAIVALLAMSLLPFISKYCRSAKITDVDGLTEVTPTT